MESLFDLNWSIPTQYKRLEGGEAHIWSASTDQPLSVYFELKALLSVDEQVKAARFRNAQARQQFILGRGLLRTLLGFYLEEHPAEISFVYGDHGKPLLFHPIAANRICFNISHAGELVLLGFSAEHEVGVDVEQVRHVPEADAIAARFFERDEIEEMANAGPRKMDAFFKIWTRKEALLKCSGEGFGGGTVQPSDTILWELGPAPAYAAAVAIASHTARIQTFRWSPEITSPRAGVLNNLL